MSNEIRFEASAANGGTIRELFNRCADVREPLDAFGGWKTDRVTQSMPPGRILTSAPAGSPPQRHRQAGYASTFSHNVEDGRLEVGSTDLRARILNEGGVIEAKDKKLAIPISAASYGRRPADFPDLILTFRRIGGKRQAFLALDDENDEGEFLFVLKNSVTIQPHPHLFWDEADEAELIARLRDYLERQ